MASSTRTTLTTTAHPAAAEYASPGPVGGKLIRRVITELRAQRVEVPLKASHIHIAVSGGLDSVALGVLLAQYGRRIAPAASLRIVHFNHRWRGESSERDEAFVRSCAKEWGIPVTVRRGRPPSAASRESWEAHARLERQGFFEAELLKRPGLVVTAHQGDDLAETLLWRIFTGTTDTHGLGIHFQFGSLLRPLLGVRRSELHEFVREEGVPWREDESNVDPRFLRVRMRQELVPVVERLFPKAVNHLIRQSLEAQRRDPGVPAVVPSRELVDALRMAQVPLRRKHWELIREKHQGGNRWSGEILLPEGWKLTRGKI